MSDRLVLTIHLRVRTVRTEVYALTRVGGAFERHEVEMDVPDVNEVAVEVVASGICYSDLHVVNGTSPAAMPTVLGHEGTGIVRACGSAVTGLKASPRLREQSAFR